MSITDAVKNLFKKNLYQITAPDPTITPEFQARVEAKAKEIKEIEELTIALKDKKHYKTTTVWGDYSSTKSYALNENVKVWLRENEIKYTWHAARKKKPVLVFKNRDDAMRFKLTWG